MKPTTIKLFLISGDPKGLRTAQLSNWSGKAVAGPRSSVDDVRKREESKKPGVYFLIGRDEDSESERIYIGESEVIEARLAQHLAKEFWTQVIFFVSKDENLTKSHTKYLESRLINEATKCNRYLIENSNSSGAKLPEEDRAEMDEFFENIMRISPIMGVDAFIPLSGISSTNNNRHHDFKTEIKSCTAHGCPSQNGFLVKKGSEAILTDRDSCPEPIIKLRKILIEKKILIGQKDKFVFDSDYEFTSSSQAAAVVHAGSANGRISWRTSNGKTLKDIEEELDLSLEVQLLWYAEIA